MVFVSFAVMSSPSKSLDIWNFVSDQHQAGFGVLLLQVVESTGSSPGRQGFRMAVSTSGQMHGSIGGGVMEYKLVEMAKSRLKEDNSETSVHRQIHDKAAPRNQSGMICSGEQTVVLYQVHTSDFEAIKTIIQRLQENEPVNFILNPHGIQTEAYKGIGSAEWSKNSESDWQYREHLGFRYQLHIIGGGHCSLAFSRIMAMLDFEIHLYEDRPDLNTFISNSFAHHKTILADYQNVNQHVKEGQNQFVVVMTFGYRTDDVIVRSLRGMNFGFLGVLGSRKKIEKMWDQYRQDGFDPEWLDQISAPVGIPIRSQTPEEIAISIAAEVIRKKNAY